MRTYAKTRQAALAYTLLGMALFLAACSSGVTVNSFPNTSGSSSGAGASSSSGTGASSSSSGSSSGGSGGASSSSSSGTGSSSSSGGAPSGSTGGGTPPAPTPIGQAYVTNAGDNTISAFVVYSDGSMTPLPSSPYTTGADPISVCSDAAGQYVFTANHNGNSLSGYRIQSDGSLAAMLPALYSTGRGPAQVVVDPGGRFIYAVNTADASVSQYSLGMQGQVSPLSPASVPVGGQPFSLTAGVAGFVVVSSGFANVSPFVVGADGALTAGQVAHTVDNQAAWIAADPVGPFVYVTDTGLNGLVGYQVNAGGGLSQLSTVPSGQNVRSLVVDPLGRWCYVATLGGNVIQFNISASGTLTQQQSTNVASSVDAMAIDPSDRFLFVVNSGAASITTLSIGSDGTLSPAVSVTAGVGRLPSSITVTPLASSVAGRGVIRRSIRR